MMSHHHSSAAASVKGGTGLLVGTRQLCHVGKFQASTLLERRIKRHKKVLNRVFGYFRYNRRSCSSNLPGLWDSVKQGVLDTTNSRQEEYNYPPVHPRSPCERSSAKSSEDWSVDHEEGPHCWARLMTGSCGHTRASGTSGAAVCARLGGTTTIHSLPPPLNLDPRRRIPVRFVRESRNLSRFVQEDQKYEYPRDYSFEQTVTNETETLSREYNNSKARLEELILMTRKETDREELAALNAEADTVETRLLELADLLWMNFQSILRVPIPDEHFDKAAFDEEMERAFGSINQVGTGTFHLGENQCDVKTAQDANLVFSLYLARKVLCPVSRKKLETSLTAFFERVESPAPPDPLRSRALTFISRLAEDLFTSKGMEKFSETPENFVPTHASGSVEVERSRGGKRELYYGLMKGEYDLETIKPEAIYTGGKVRVITLDSAKNLDYAYLNTFMGNRIRKEKWCIFGADVAEFLDKNPEFLGTPYEYVSGDLESATDLFDGRFAEEVFKVLIKIDPDLDHEDFKRMCGFTTRAPLKTTLEGIGKKATWVQVFQERGQLMGSILSFPILCLVSLTAWAVGYDKDLEYMATPTRAERRKLREAWLVGINGDDIIFPAADRGIGWEKGVSAVGGRVSRGKSLTNSVCFTVNSELWFKEGEHWIAPMDVRPSVVLGIADGRAACPEKLWKRIFGSPLIDSEHPILDLICRRMKAHLPKSMGGLGCVNQFVLRDVLRWKIQREEAKPKKLILPGWSEPEIQRLRCKKVRLRASKETHDHVRRVFGEPWRHLPRWSDRGTERSYVERKLHNQLHMITAAEIEELYQLWAYRMHLQELGESEALVPIDLVPLAATMGATPARRGKDPAMKDWRRGGGVLDCESPNEWMMQKLCIAREEGVFRLRQEDEACEARKVPSPEERHAEREALWYAERMSWRRR